MNKRRANWIKTLRARANITQDDVAARLQIAGFDYTRGAINNWESDRNQPPVHNAEFRQAFADALKVDVRTLLKMAGYEVDTGEHSIVAEQVAYIVDNLPPDKQQLALALVEQLAKV
jgi:transcriptional regulator with XRE-family HTH domain